MNPGSRACFVVFLLSLIPAASSSQTIVSLDESRTGNGFIAEDVYLTSPIMVSATQILLDAGFAIETAPFFTEDFTSGASVLFTGLIDVPFTDEELDHLMAFVEAGGGLIIMRDWGTFYPAADPVANFFGFFYDVSPQGPAGQLAAVVPSQPHPIWTGPAGTATSFDQIYSAAILSGGDTVGIHANEGTPALAVATVGLGTVICLTDSAAWMDPNTPAGSSNAIVWENLFQFAAGGVAPPQFIRGDADGDGTLQPLADGVFTLVFQFVPGSPAPPCMAAIDADGSNSFSGLADGLYILNFGFIPGSPPMPDPFPLCGTDLDTVQALGCLDSPCP